MKVEERRQEHRTDQVDEVSLEAFMHHFHVCIEFGFKIAKYTNY